MTALFAKLYLDENMDVLLSDLLAHRGICATTAHAAGLLRADDPTQLAYASTHGYSLVTHNGRHFERLHQRALETGQAHSGIIIASVRPAYTLAARLATLLNTLTADELMNQLFYI